MHLGTCPQGMLEEKKDDDDDDGDIVIEISWRKKPPMDAANSIITLHPQSYLNNCHNSDLAYHQTGCQNNPEAIFVGML